MSVRAREDADGTEMPTAWFAFNGSMRQSVSFANLEEANAFCVYPENQR